MDGLLLKLAEIVDKAGSMLNLNSTSGSIALGVGMVIVLAVLISAIWKFAKKVVGTGVAIVLSVVLLVSGGFLTLGQVRNFLEASGTIVKDGWASTTEEGGSAFIDWMQDLINDEDSDVGGFDFTPNEGFFNE
jgi:hypothetical protein